LRPCIIQLKHKHLLAPHSIAVPAIYLQKGVRCLDLGGFSFLSYRITQIAQKLPFEQVALVEPPPMHRREPGVGTNELALAHQILETFGQPLPSRPKDGSIELGTDHRTRRLRGPDAGISERQDVQLGLQLRRTELGQAFLQIVLTKTLRDQLIGPLGQIECQDSPQQILFRAEVSIERGLRAAQPLHDCIHRRSVEAALCKKPGCRSHNILPPLLSSAAHNA